MNDGSPDTLGILLGIELGVLLGILLGTTDILGPSEG